MGINIAINPKFDFFLPVGNSSSLLSFQTTKQYANGICGILHKYVNIFNHTLILVGVGHDYIRNNSSMRIYSYSIL